MAGNGGGRRGVRSFVRLLILGSLLAASTAHADVEEAREDIVDMRKGRMPSRVSVLGWTEQGAFVFRETECDRQDVVDAPACHVAIFVAERGKTRSFPMFSTEWPSDCREPADVALGCWTITTEAASAFLAAERDLRARLGPLTAGTPIDRVLPAGRLSVVRYEDQPADRRKAAIVLVKGGRWRALKVISSIETGSNTFLRRAPVIERVERSPDGDSLAIVTASSYADTDYYWQQRGVDVVPVPR